MRDHAGADNQVFVIDLDGGLEGIGIEIRRARDVGDPAIEIHLQRPDVDGRGFL